MLASKGMAEEAEQMADSVTAALLKAADDGHGGYYPVIMDASTCSVRMQKHLAGRLTVLDFHEFAHDALLPRLMVTRKRGPIALHINCSVRRVASDSKLRRLIAACAEEIVEPAGVTCCGFAGDRGFVVPELNVPRPAQGTRGAARQLLRGSLDQPHLRNRPHRRNRPPLPLHCLPAGGVQSYGNHGSLLSPGNRRHNSHMRGLLQRRPHDMANEC
jgi:hypothetical protein